MSIFFSDPASDAAMSATNCSTSAPGASKVSCANTWSPSVGAATSRCESWAGCNKAVEINNYHIDYIHACMLN